MRLDVFLKMRQLFWAFCFGNYSKKLQSGKCSQRVKSFIFKEFTGIFRCFGRKNFDVILYKNLICISDKITENNEAKIKEKDGFW